MSGGIRSAWECVKAWVLTCRVNSCCCLAPLRIGLMLIGYLNVIVALVMIVGTASGVEMFSPMVSRIQAAILEDDASTVWILVPVNDLAASVVLLCAIYRNDVKLCRLFMYISAASIFASVIMYAIVIVTLQLLNLMIIALTISYQVYVIILVRSFRIEIKLREATEKTKFTYDNRYGTVTITDITEPNTEIKLKDVKLEILDEKDAIEVRGNTLPRSSTLKSTKSNTIGLNKSSTLNRFEPATLDEPPAMNSEINIPKRIATHDVAVSVTPVDIIASRAYLISDRLKSNIKKDVTPNVKEGTVTTTAVIETVKETNEHVKGDDSNTDKKAKTVDNDSEASKTEETKADVPQKKKRGIFSMKSKTKETDKKGKDTTNKPDK